MAFTKKHLRFLLVGIVSIYILVSEVPSQADNRYLIAQSTQSDCGPAALATLLNFYLNVPAKEDEMARLSGATLVGTTLVGLETAAKAKGCAADSFRMDYATLQSQLNSYPAPVIVRVLNPSPHFSVVIAAGDEYVFLADPAYGNIALRKAEFLKSWYIPAEPIAVPVNATIIKPSNGQTANGQTAGLAPAAKEGYVFLAVGPDAQAGLARRIEVAQRLSRQLDNLKTVRSSVAAFRR